MLISTIFYNFARDHLLKTRNPQFTQETVSLHIDFYSNYCTLYRREEKFFTSVYVSEGIYHIRLLEHMCVWIIFTSITQYFAEEELVYW